MAGYAIDFVAILQYEIHDKLYKETANLPFPCMIQRLFDEDDVSKIPSIDKKVLATATV